MAQNLGDVVTITNFYAENGYLEGSVNGGSYQEFTSYTLIANQQMTLLGDVILDSNYVTDPVYFSYITFECPKIIIDNTNARNGIAIGLMNNSNKLIFSNASVNFDKAIYYTDPEYNGPISFLGTSSINITSSTIGKRIIKASVLIGTVTLDVEDGVQEGDTFLVESSDNQLVIADGDWIATTSTSGDITTYTLSKAAIQKPKFRLLYTIG